MLFNGCQPVLSLTSFVDLLKEILGLLKVPQDKMIHSPIRNNNCFFAKLLVICRHNILELSALVMLETLSYLMKAWQATAQDYKNTVKSSCWKGKYKGM